MSGATARLVVKLGPTPEKEYFLTQSEVTIGRSAGNTIVIPNPEISRRHARIRKIGGSYQIEDWGSTNGTFVSGQRIMNSVILNDKDEIQLGDTITFLFRETLERFEFPREESQKKPDVDLTFIDPPSQDSAQKEEAPLSSLSAQTDEVSHDEFILPDEEPGPTRNRTRLLGCGCAVVLIPLLCIGLILFLDFYEQGRLLYCGPIRPIFEIILGPIGFSPICP